MSLTHRMAFSYTGSGRTTSPAQSAEATGSQEQYIEETVANGQTDSAIVFALDVSACKSFFAVSDKAVTLETNSGSAADNTIALAANVPYFWNVNSYDSFLLDTDVTAIYITNASGATATIKIHALTDATP